jgi:hypothetical protein
MAKYRIRVEIIGKSSYFSQPVAEEWDTIPRIGETVILKDQLEYTVKEIVHDFRPIPEICLKVERLWR